MWWRRCKTAHTLVTTFANCFVTLATSCKMLEVLVDIYAPFSVIKRKNNKYNIIIIVIKKFTTQFYVIVQKKIVKNNQIVLFLISYSIN